LSGELNAKFSPEQAMPNGSRVTMTATEPKRVASADMVSATKPLKRKPIQATDQENWDQRLGFLMHDVSRLRRTVFDEVMRPLGVTRSQWWVLANLSRNDGMFQSELANLLDMGKVGLGGLVDRLEASGLAQRRAHKSDRRINNVFLSPKGDRLVKKMLVLNQEVSERVLEGLDQESRVSLTQMLTKVKHNLQKMRGSNGNGADGECSAFAGSARHSADSRSLP
jgi:MarR family transcriptional regulator, transcriptional regulator for hemolysin